jgi:hypothetical protein
MEANFDDIIAPWEKRSNSQKKWKRKEMEQLQITVFRYFIFLKVSDPAKGRPTTYTLYARVC